MNPYLETVKLGLVGIRNRRYEEALSHLRSVPPESEYYSLALGNQAMALQSLGRYREAESVATAALVLCTDGAPVHEPSEIQFIRTLAECISIQGRYREALDVFASMDARAGELIGQKLEIRSEVEIQLAHGLSSWGGTALQVKEYQLADEVIRKARDLYSLHQKQDPVGRAEALTNHSHALRELGRKVDAELALREALEIATSEDHADQIDRIYIGLVQLGAIEFLSAYSELMATVDRAISMGNSDKAYLRLCILASESLKHEQLGLARQAVDRAKSIEGEIEVRGLNPPNLRAISALLGKLESGEIGPVIKERIEGAFLWFQQLGYPLVGSDFLQISGVVHEHFTWLSEDLRRSNRIAEALVSFEAGRALAHAIEASGFLGDGVTLDNPFNGDGSAVSDRSLKELQAKLSGDEVHLSIGLFDEALITFIVGRNQLLVAEVAIPQGGPELEMFHGNLSMIPERLWNRVDDRAIPGPIWKLAQQIKALVGDRTVSGLAPHSLLHNVPWRVVLHEIGMVWGKLAWGTGFRILPFGLEVARSLPRPCIAMGYGVAGAQRINLEGEARSFANTFGEEGEFRAPCDRLNVMKALSEEAIVFLSCHGLVDDADPRCELRLELQDGEYRERDYIPESVKAPVVLLSCCESGVYKMGRGDHPVGAVATLIRNGALYCVGARYRIDAVFSAAFFVSLGKKLAFEEDIQNAFVNSLDELEKQGFDRWRDLACIELLRG